MSKSDETKTLYFNLDSRDNNILYGTALEGDKDYISENNLEYRAWFNERKGGYKTTYYDSDGNECQDGFFDLIKIESDTIRKEGGKYVFQNTIEIHHPLSPSQSYLKLDLYGQYWTLYGRKVEDLIRLDHIQEVFVLKEL